MFHVIVIKKMKHCDTDQVLPYALWNFDNSEEVKLSCEKQFLLFCIFVRRNTRGCYVLLMKNLTKQLIQLMRRPLPNCVVA